uniref:Uncharacterized protein n=1 Tax=Chromera velia CCMP2878 TaxID=1169474 RepID=A0A0G4HVA5_9ALVE|eukprot:Cvel_32200.t1-p1 / transcript=Cvel_32200.t1 / gene=Cvel_32200 / organism=Chromera_velia_CCMP2878 / gene_product=hypothetical protein / transcript_product=hypothetical protein / location=Cvel_scaffold4952:4770-5446(+) / protein_length=115 / sequence_SO=supercontig / SO=protein_coding / is_pseudo=false
MQTHRLLQASKGDRGRLSAELFVIGFMLSSFMKDPETEPMNRMMKAKELSARVYGTAWKPDGFLELLVVMFGLEKKHREVMIQKVGEWFEKNKTLPTLSNMQTEFEAITHTVLTA